MTELERKEMEALEYAEVPNLPAEYTGGAIWVKAIAKITTMTNSQSYAIVVNDSGDKPSVVRVFDTQGIASIDHIYPFSFLDGAALAPLKNADDLKELISRAYGIPQSEVNRLGKKELTKLFVRFAVRKQLKDEREKRLLETKKAIKSNNDEQGTDTETN